MDISVFKTFTIVAKYGSISIASEEVHLTQPAVTKQIKYLEELYGMKFFERGSKLRLTEAGKVLLVYANQILNAYNDSFQAISESEEQVRGVLKFGSNLTLGVYVLPKLMSHFSALYPDVKPDIFLHNTENIVRAIKQKAVNFGFISADIKEPQILRHVFYEDRITIVAGKQLGLKSKTVGWNELQRLPFIMRERGSDIRETVEQWLKDKSIPLQPKMELNNTEAIKACVRCGIGFSCLPRCTVEEDLRLGLLQEIHAPYFEPVQKFYICHYEGRRFSKPERIFLEFLFEAIESRSGSLPRASIVPPKLRNSPPA